MPLPLIAAFGVAKLLAPRIGHLLGGKRGEEIATQITDTALQMTGESDANTLQQKLLQEPELLQKLSLQMREMEVHILREETERLTAINQTMQIEARSDDAYVRRWRPTYGYLTAIAWFAMMFGSSAAIFWTAVHNPTEAPVIIAALGTALSQSSMLWGIALAVLGVAVHCRSKDKQKPTNEAAGVFESLAGLWRKKD